MKIKFFFETGSDVALAYLELLILCLTYQCEPPPVLHDHLILHVTEINFCLYFF